MSVFIVSFFSRHTHTRTHTHTHTHTHSPLSAAATRNAFSLSASTTSVVEEDTPNVVFNVSRSGPTTDAVSVRLATIDFDASRGADYTRSSASRVISFAAGEAWHTETIPILDDATPELAEKFALALTQPTLVSGTNREVLLEDGAAVVVITIQASDDPQGIISLQRAGDTIALSEPETGSRTLSIAVSRAAGSFGSISVDWTLQGDAQAHDFDAIAGAITFGAGETAANITLQLTADAVPELLETSTLRLLSASNGASVNGAASELTITVEPNDDPHGVAFIAHAQQQIVTLANQRALRVFAERSGGTFAPVNVTVDITFGTSAIITNDLPCLAQDILDDRVVITIPAGASSAEAILPFADDVLLEQNSAFCLQASSVELADGTPQLMASDSLSPRLNASLVDARVSVERAFANGIVGFAGTSVNQNEPSTTRRDITVVLVRSGGGYGTLDVELTLTGDSEYAKPGSDVSISTNVSHFDPLDSLQELTVSIHPDNIPELAEVFDVTVANIPSGRAAIDAGSSVLQVTVPVSICIVLCAVLVRA